MIALVRRQEETEIAFVIGLGPQHRPVRKIRRFHRHVIVAVIKRVERIAAGGQSGADDAQVVNRRAGIIGKNLNVRTLESDLVGRERQSEIERLARLYHERIGSTETGWKPGGRILHLT